MTKSEHERKELIICILHHIGNLEDLGIAKLMSFTQDGINFIEEVGTQEAALGRESIKHLKGSVKEPNILIYSFFPITQSCSISDVLFTGGRGVTDFSVLKYY